MNNRIFCLKQRLNALNIDGMIVTNPSNILYLTDLKAEGILLLTKEENIFLTDGRYIEDVNNVLSIEDEITVHDFKDFSEEEYEEFFKSCNSVGYEEHYVTCADYKNLLIRYKVNEFKETERVIEKLRMVKDESEIDKIAKACKLTDECFNHLVKYIKIGMTEIEIANEIERFFKENNAVLSFDPIVASGVNSSKPHAVPTDKKIENGDIITIDMGCKLDGYCSDMTRTIFAGYVRNEYARIYDLVLKNQELVSKQIYAGQSTKILNNFVENDFRLNGFALIHALGHGVGLEVHELPFISSKVDEFLKENTVITNEPGIYIQGQFGVRIEDTIVVKKENGIALTSSSKEYVIVDEQ